MQEVKRIGIHTIKKKILVQQRLYIYFRKTNITHLHYTTHLFTVLKVLNLVGLGPMTFRSMATHIPPDYKPFDSTDYI